jgi:phenylalanyl-tRNA synthetase alpha chain
MTVNDLDALQARATAELAAAKDEAALRAWNTKYLGKTGEVTLAMKDIGKVAKESRGEYGQKANAVKKALEAAYEQEMEGEKERALQASLAETPLDVTLPGRQPTVGRLHPSTQALRRISGIFVEMGFQVYRSPDVETDELNFELLNMPSHHPARDMWDTFYTTKPGVLLRTHTSPGQIHVMRQLCPKPVRVILPGMCYRHEQVTTRHEMMFNQIEGLAIGEHISFTDLKGTLLNFARRLFGPQRQIRIRSSYFPFTEPSIEVDVDWPREDPNCDRLTKGTGWLEIAGAGMVHPTVLRNGGYDPAKFSGFAFGMGIERVVMLLSGLDDIRQFWRNDVRFLRQF